jgi:cytochrome P450
MQALSKLLTLATEYVPTLFDSKLLLAIGAYYLIHKLIIEEYFTPLAKIPGVKPSWFTLLEMYYTLLFKPESTFIHRLHQRYGPIIHIGPKLVSIASPDLVRTVYMTYRFPKASQYEPFDFYGENIFSTRNNALHKQLKKLIAPAYSQTAITNLEPLIHETGVNRLVKLLYRYAETGEPIDLLYAFQLMAFDVIGEIGFGRKFGMLDEGKEHPVVKWLEDIGNLGVMKLFFSQFLAPKIFRRLKRSEDALIEFAREAIEIRRSQGNGARVDTLQRLLEAVDPETGARLSDKQLISEAILQLIAGTDTTAVTLTWIMYRLQQNPECLERLRKEVLEAVPDLDQPVTHAAIHDLSYLDAVINETQRLHPIVSAAFDRAVPDEGVELGGYFLPKGTVVIVSVSTLHEDPNVFPDPTTFKPERWLDDEEKVAKMKQSFIPFLIGPRACTGRL